MGKVSDYLAALISRQIDDHGLVVWYDPQKAYSAFIRRLALRALQGQIMLHRVSSEGKVGIYRIEVGTSSGTGKLKMAGGIDSSIRECLNRAFGFLQGHKVQMGIASVLDTTDLHVEVIDLLANRITCEAGIAFVVAMARPFARLLSLLDW